MRRLTIVYLALLTLSHSPASSVAGETQSSLDIQGLVSTTTYKDKSPLPSADHGLLPGVALTYTRQGSDRLYLRLHGDVVTGTLGYSTTQPHTSLVPLGTAARLSNPASGKSAVFGWRAEADLGYTWVSRLFPTVALTPYGGVGYRRYAREAANAIDVSTQWIYAVGGIRADWFLSPRWRTGLDLAVELPLFMKETSGIIWTNYGGASIQSDGLSSRPGFRVMLPTVYRLNKEWALTVTPTWEHFTIGSGKNGWPGNSATIFGTYFGIRYNFS